MSKEYKNETALKYREKTKELFYIMPSFCRDYYLARHQKLSEKTQYDYIYKMKIFLEYLIENCLFFNNKTLKEITIEDICKLNQKDMIEFTTWLSEQKTHRNSNIITATNSKSTIENYIACLSSYYSYFIREGYISINPFLGIDRAPIKQKPIIYLRPDDKSDVLNTISNGEGLTPKQLEDFTQRTSLRDKCIITLLLSTGLRVSELVGLDIEDIDFKHNKIRIQRKRDKEDNIFVSDEMIDILNDYIENWREPRKFSDDIGQPLFISTKGTNKGQRLSERSVQLLVKKICTAAGVKDASQITPHKLRSTFAMESLQKSENIAVVKEQLGHDNLNTTQIYAKATDKDKELHRNDITLYEKR